MSEKERFAQKESLFFSNAAIDFVEKSKQCVKEMKDLIRDYDLYYTAPLHSENKRQGRY